MTMEHTPEQQNIIRRIGDVNKRIDEATAAHRALQAAEARGFADATQALAGAVQALAGTMDRTAEIHRLCREHGDLFREYLDTLL